VFNLLIHLKKIFLDIGRRFNSVNKKKIRLLIVGDNLVNYNSVSIYIDLKLLMIRQSRTCNDALSLLRENCFDLIFIDPEIANIGIATMVKEVRRMNLGSHRTPLIAMNMTGEKEAVVRVLSCGFDDYLVKPFDHKNLGLILNRWLEKKTPHNTRADSVQTLTEITSKKILCQSNSNKKTKATDSYSSVSSSTPRSVSNRTIDIAVSLQFSNYDNELARDLLLLLIKSATSEKNKFADDYYRKNWLGMNESAHKLYGISCYCGALLLQEKAKALEVATKHCNIPDIKRLQPELMTAIDELLVWSETHDIDVIFNLK
jgi:two-component system sensor histidine kinase BarA